MDQKNLGLENKKFKKISIFMNILIAMLIELLVVERLRKFYINLENFLMHLLIKRVKIMREIIIKLKTLQNNDIIVVQIAGLLHEELFVSQ